MPTWSRLLDLWMFIECDLQDMGVDVGDEALMTSRPWPWLRTRIFGLLSADTRLARVIAPPLTNQ